tara:strand:- start:406 stop:1338 length:933 start_codon:yes stop_codon:yes gene_type:complete
MKIDGREVEKVLCNNCESNDLKQLWIKDNFSYCQCNKCKLNFISPRLTLSEINKIYEVGYDSKNLHKPPPHDFSLYSLFFKTIEKYRLNNQLLDVGCFRGDILFGAKQKSWDVHGIEISEKAAEYGKINYDIDINIGSLFDAKYDSNFFDVISMFDVIEHLSDPSSYLYEINRILRPGGVLYVDTPNFNSINRYIFKEQWSVFFPWHLYYFTPNSLINICHKNSLIVKKVITEDWGPISTNNVYHSLNSGNKISKTPSSNFMKYIFKFRSIIKPIYKLVKSLINIPLIVLSKLKINIGSKIILIAEKQSK